MKRRPRGIERPSLAVWVIGLMLGAVGLTGCSLAPEAPAEVAQHRLVATASSPYRVDPEGPVLLVGSISAAGGFDATAMRYRQSETRSSRYASAAWVEPPAQMLAEAAISTLAATGRFRAVVATADAVPGDLRLSLRLLKLEHDYTASSNGVVKMVVRITLLDQSSGEIRLADKLRVSVPTTQAGPDAMAEGADRALQGLLDAMTRRVTEVL